MTMLDEIRTGLRNLTQSPLPATLSNVDDFRLTITHKEGPMPLPEDTTTPDLTTEDFYYEVIATHDGSNPDYPDVTELKANFAVAAARRFCRGHIRNNYFAPVGARWAVFELVEDACNGMQPNLRTGHRLPPHHILQLKGEYVQDGSLKPMYLPGPARKSDRDSAAWAAALHSPDYA
jgi:hypothetical protein